MIPIAYIQENFETMYEAIYEYITLISKIYTIQYLSHYTKCMNLARNWNEFWKFTLTNAPLINTPHNFLLRWCVALKETLLIPSNLNLRSRNKKIALQEIYTSRIKNNINLKRTRKAKK